jgi:hypothetical protein
MVYVETNESPCVLTNRAPVPEEVDELSELHALKPTSKAGISKPGRKRNLVPILYPCPLSRFPSRLTIQASGSRSESTFICVSGISGKSNQRWVIGTNVKQ